MKQVIVFKKLDENDKYNKLLLENQYNPHFIPVLQHQLDNLDQIKHMFVHGPSNQHIHGLILTSKRAVEAISESLSGVIISDTVKAEWNKLVIYMVGAETAKALSCLPLFQNNSHDHWFIEPKAVDLITHIKHGPLLFLSGDKRKDTIPVKLKESNIAFREIQCYHTCTHINLKFNLDLLYQQKITFDWIILYSPSGLKFILDLIQSDPTLMDYYFHSHLKIASIGPTTTEYIQSVQLQKVILPSIPIITSNIPDANNLIQHMLDYDKNM